MTESQNKVIIIDYGAQYTQLIARRVREAGVYSEIIPCTESIETIKAAKPNALILSGGPDDVGEKGAFTLDIGIMELGVPILGICYGMQLLAHYLGGKLSQGTDREYGRTDLSLTEPCPLWKGLDLKKNHVAWMSHGNHVKEVPAGFKIVAQTQTLPVAAMACEEKNIYAVQFHPEVHHTDCGTAILQNFLFEAAKLSPDWTVASFVTRCIAECRQKVGDSKVVLALSGGVDSTVVAALLHRAIGDKLHCVFVDHGLLRKEEGAQVKAMLERHMPNLHLHYVNAQDLFLDKLEGVADPERKRKIIGATFIEVFEREAKAIEGVTFLGQGTVYPDVIESITPKGNVIKSHHNVGGLPEKMDLKLIEPVRELFKDEVRKVAGELGLPEELIWRQPFPGPGLAVRILGEITREKITVLQEADAIVTQEMRSSGWYRKVWQSFAVLLPLRTVGVMGDARTYENVVALRVVDSVDAMTADWTALPYDLLGTISRRIINEVKGVNRVVYDVSSKPPSTIEWE